MDKIRLIIIFLFFISCSKKEEISELNIVYISRDILEIDFYSKKIFLIDGNTKTFVSNFNLNQEDSLRIYKSLRGIKLNKISKEVNIYDKNIILPIIKNEIHFIKNKKTLKKLIFNFNYLNNDITFFDENYKIAIFINEVQNFVNKKIDIGKFHEILNKSKKKKLILTL